MTRLTRRTSVMPISRTETSVRPLSRTASALALVGWLALAFAVVNAGLFWTETGTGSWYQQLRKPAWTPPGWVFGPAWFLNCTLMGAAAWLVWRPVGFRGAPRALGLFVAQLLVAGLFTPVFFGGRSPVGGMAVMIATLGLASATVIAFFARRPAAGAMLLPYLAWLALATSVAVGIVAMNRP